MPRLTVSFCIPTHGRSGLLLEALESGLAQTRLPEEIVVSDDTGNAETRALVENFGRRAPMPVRYVHCTTGQSQTHNMNNCLLEARCDLTLLLHDDDLLVPDSIARLAPPFEENPGVVGSYGKQLFITHDGEFIPDETERVNRGYRRGPAYAGLQPSALLAAIWQQFPNDGYMVRTAVARGVLYRSEYRAATDFEFGVRLAGHGEFFYVDDFASKYRNSLDSVARGAGVLKDDSAYFGTRLLLEKLEEHPEHRDEITTALKGLIPMGIVMGANTGRIDEAIAWYFGPYHRARIPTPGGIKRGLYLLKRRWAGLRSPGE
jgi:glycosyltransferase involved in cell wall biosynthesis